MMPAKQIKEAEPSSQLEIPGWLENTKYGEHILQQTELSMRSKITFRFLGRLRWHCLHSTKGRSLSRARNQVQQRNPKVGPTLASQVYTHRTTNHVLHFPQFSISLASIGFLKSG